ncbi:MAG: hypothetical protein DMG07_20605 [Acidobacteria bacterium]|nr:MAG: hypothetical protein DMG07_20605 [Acidobacteriota bacterium]
MKVDWRAYPDNIGHKIFDGCFRCHDGKHRSDDSRVVRKDCSVCHEVQRPIAADGRGEVLEQRVPEHPVRLEGTHAELTCSACHTGGRAPESTCAGCHKRTQRFLEGKTTLPGVEVSPAAMAGVDCDSCHDPARLREREALAPRCDQCHDEGYGEMIDLWKEEATTGRNKALASLAPLKNNPKRSPELDRLLTQAQAALDEVDRAGALHNPPLADAVYEAVVKLAQTAPAPAGK